MIANPPVGVVLSTEDAASPENGSNGIQQAAGFFEIIDLCCAYSNPPVVPK